MRNISKMSIFIVNILRSMAAQNAFFCGVSLFKWFYIKSATSINIHGEIHWRVLPFIAKISKILGKKDVWCVFYPLRREVVKNAWYGLVFSDYKASKAGSCSFHSFSSLASPGADCSLGRVQLARRTKGGWGGEWEEGQCIEPVESLWSPS